MSRVRFELTTITLRGYCSTAELPAQTFVFYLNWYNTSMKAGAEFKDNFLNFSFVVLISISGALIGGYLSLFFKEFNPFLIFLFSIALSSWYLGFRAGLVSLLVSLFTFLGYLYLFPSPDIFWLDLIVVCIIGLFISFLLDKARKIDEIFKHKKQIYDLVKKLTREKIINEEAKAEIKLRDEFLSIASHELKTPLTLVLLQIQNALHNIRNVSLANFSVSKLLEMLESVEQQTNRLSRMISDLLNVSLITTGKLNLEKEKTDLAAIVKDVSKRLPEIMNQKGYPISVSSKGSIIGNWDKIRVEQAIINLLSNAIKYGNKKLVEVKVQKSDSVAKLIIKDKGIGIPKEVRNRIFERFERGNGVKSIQGLGVGLYITRQIITAHKGTIKLDSKENNGSTFTVELPLH